MILAIKTDQPRAELYLFKDARAIDEKIWLADRKLADTLLAEIMVLLKRNGASPGDLVGVIVFEGPGSFTGLRIGITVANTLAYSLKIPVTGAHGDNWIEAGLDKIPSRKMGQFIVPFYGAEPNITPPKR